MPDKSTTPDSACFALPDQGVIALQGRDALAFAQAQGMNDVATLDDNHWQWNGWLTPKGRLIALFALLRLDAETLWLLVPDANTEELAARLRRFVFRSKLTISVRDDLHVSGAFASSAGANGAHFPGDSDRGAELDLAGEGGARSLRIAVDATAGRDEAALARWKAFDLAHGLPRLPASQGEQWTPQQLSLDRLRAYSVKKGCYPGQEIVARTHFLGQAKRGLVRLRIDGMATPGDRVLAADRAIGDLVATVAFPDHATTEALAVLPINVDEQPLRVEGGGAARVEPLLAGLAR